MYISGLQARRCAFFLLFALLFALGGCASLHGFKENPKISIADIRIRDVRAMEGIFLIKLRILNPNEVPLDLHGVSCELEINKRHFASGIGDSNLTVPAYGTTVVPVEVYASVLDVVASVADLIQNVGRPPAKDQPVPYTLHGTVVLGIRGFSKEVPFTSSGEISLKGLPLPR